MRNADLIALGNLIKAKRAEINITQTELAFRMCKDKQFPERIENAKVNPTILTLIEIANALETNISSLLESNLTSGG